MKNLKQGDIIVDEYGEREVLGVCGRIVFISHEDEFGVADSIIYTIEELIEGGYTIKEEECPCDNLENGDVIRIGKNGCCVVCGSSRISIRSESEEEYAYTKDGEIIGRIEQGKIIKE